MNKRQRDSTYEILVSSAVVGFGISTLAVIVPAFIMYFSNESEDKKDQIYEAACTATAVGVGCASFLAVSGLIANN